MNEDKLDSQAETYEWVNGYDAIPLSGPGRWMKFPDGTIIYTNDQNILFVKNDQEATLGLLEAVRAIRKLFKAGKTTTEAFETLRGGNVPVTTGDLSEIA